MTEENPRNRLPWKTVAIWVWLTTLGYILGADFHYNPDAPVDRLNLQDLNLFAALVGFLMSAVAGLIVAVLQWNVLKAWSPTTRLWIPMNGIAFGLVHALNDSLPYLPLPISLILGTGGLIVGLAQFIALRPVLSKPLRWIPFAAGAWVMGFQSSFMIQYFVAGNPLAGVVLGHGTAGLITGLVTGLALKFMLLEPKIQVRNQPDQVTI